MKKGIRIGIVLLFLITVYNSKSSDYVIGIEFFKKHLNAKVLEIKGSRGAKVYYSNDDFFYLDMYRGIPIKVGDYLVKVDSIVKIYRNDKFIGTGEILKPKDSYFEYFFDL